MAPTSGELTCALIAWINGARPRVIRESDVRHDLPEVRLVASPVVAQSRARRGARRHRVGIEYLTCLEVHRTRLVIHFNPWFVEFIPNADIQRKTWEDLVIVVHKAGRSPLALSNVDAGQRRLHRLHTVEQEVRAPISSAARGRSKSAGIVHRTQIAIVIG